MNISSNQVGNGYVFFSTLKKKTWSVLHAVKKCLYFERILLSVLTSAHIHVVHTPSGHRLFPPVSRVLCPILVSPLWASDITVLSLASSSWWSCFRAFLWLGLSPDSIAWLLCQGGKISVLGIRWWGPLESAAWERMEEEEEGVERQ